VILVACGGGSLTVSEYAAQAEGLVAEMEARFASLDAEWYSQAPSAERARSYWDRRLAVRTVFLESIEALEPPAEIADLHAVALDVFSRITEADKALAARVATYETVTEHRQWADTPEAQALVAVLDEVFAFCRAIQAEFDATEKRESLQDVAWLPPEMKEIVKVAFGCPP
jgi:hypothetical protein